MTPKEKAKELIKRMSITHYIKLGDPNSKGMPVSMLDVHTKQCALICVDEILKEVITFADRKYDYFTEVKEEIEKL